MLEGFGIGANDGLGEKRQALQVAHTGHRAWIEAGGLKQLSIVRDMCAHINQQLTQARGLERGTLVTGQPLRLLHLSAHFNAVVPLETLMQRKQQRRDEFSVETHGVPIDVGWAPVMAWR